MVRMIVAILFVALYMPHRGFASEYRNIFPLQRKHVHSSSIVELANGNLIACWYHGSGERRANDVLIQASRFDVKTRSWGPVFTIADTPHLPDCNPVFFHDEKNRLWLFWIVPIGNRWENSVLKYRRCETFDHNGMPQWTWQDSVHLVPGSEFAAALAEDFKKTNRSEGLWAEYALPYSRMLVQAAADPAKRQTGWMPRIHPITIPSGRILLPLYSDGFNVSLMAISDDQGKTFRPSRPIVGLGPIQPTVVRKKSGDLVAYFRDSGGHPYRVLQSISQDDGETWSIAQDTSIPNPGSSLEVITIADGSWVMVFNDTSRGRHRLSLARSDDEGKSWKWKRDLEFDEQKKKGFSYPSLIQTQNGQLHVTYSVAGQNGATIRHAEISPDWIYAKP